MCAWLTNAGFHDLYCITYYLTHTDEDAVLDTLTSGPTTIDISDNQLFEFTIFVQKSQLCRVLKSGSMSHSFQFFGWFKAVFPLIMSMVQ